MGTRASGRARVVEIHNLGVVSTYNCQHIGRMADYVAMAAAQDMIGYCCVNSTPSVVPFGGIQRMFNQSPLGWGIPAGEEPPIILDISTSVCAGGKITRALEESNCHRGVSSVRTGSLLWARKIIIVEEQVCLSAAAWDTKASASH